MCWYLTKKLSRTDSEHMAWLFFWLFCRKVDQFYWLGYFFCYFVERFGRFFRVPLSICMPALSVRGSARKKQKRPRNRVGRSALGNRKNDTKMVGFGRRKPTESVLFLPIRRRMKKEKKKTSLLSTTTTNNNSSTHSATQQVVRMCTDTIRVRMYKKSDPYCSEQQS